LGGFAKVIAQKNVKQFYMINLSLADYGSDSYRSAVAQFNIKKVSRGILEEGMTFSLGKEVSVEVFSPDKGMSVKDLKSYSDADINFHSTVFKVTYKGTSFLFAGDIYQDREKMLVDKYGSKLQADMMHAPHHGSSSSSSDAYIRAVKPKIAVFSFHRINSDGFQNWLRYEKQGAKVYHTGVNGNILITSDGKQLNVLTEKDYNFR
jgi:beta-lactamase superfamily II metal-dependent hydrolase